MRSISFQKITRLKGAFNSALCFIILTLISCTENQNLTVITGLVESPEKVLKLEMNLSAFGVEADHIPSISATIDFEKQTSKCVKSFFNPAYEGGTYELTQTEMNSVKELLEAAKLSELKKEYSVNYSDQLRSTLLIVTSENEYTVDDYGLVGDAPLQQIYDIVYKLSEMKRVQN